MSSEPQLLRILVGPTFTERPVDQMVLEGGSVVFLCRAEGIPSPQISWLRNGIHHLVVLLFL